VFRSVLTFLIRSSTINPFLGQASYIPIFIFLSIILWIIYYLGQIGDWPIATEFGVRAANFTSLVVLRIWVWAFPPISSVYGYTANIQSVVRFGLCNSKSTIRDKNALIRLHLYPKLMELLLNSIQNIVYDARNCYKTVQFTIYLKFTYQWDHVS